MAITTAEQNKEKRMKRMEGNMGSREGFVLRWRIIYMCLIKGHYGLYDLVLAEIIFADGQGV